MELPHLVDLRRKRGWTQAELAERCGTYVMMIGRLERGMRVMTLPWAERLARALEVEPEDIMFAASSPRVPIAGEADAEGRVAPLAPPHSLTILPRAMKREGTEAIRLGPDGLFPYLPGGFLLFYRRGDTPESIAEKLCLVETLDGQSLIRHLAQAGALNRFTLCGQPGTRPQENVELRRAFPIRAMIDGNLVPIVAPETNPGERDR